MRKQTKLVAVLSAAALLAIGASMTSFAATGWDEQDGTWVYLDKDGDRVTETWKRSGSNYFWLDENGEMATDMVVEDGDETYYVDENGARVANQWKSVPNDDVCADMDSDTVWFYFGNTGKAYKDTDSANGKGRKSIAGKTYIFDEDGHMCFGWKDYDGNLYYLGEENEGWATTGWALLELDDEVITISDEYEDEEWFWFDSVGKAARDKRKYINKAYYTFDKQGIMKNKWLIGTPGAPASGSTTTTPPTAATAYYDEEVGNQLTGWAYVVPHGKDEGDEAWFYLSSKGEPFNYKTAEKGYALKYEFGQATSTDRTGVAARVIKNKTYLFDNDGIMLTGVWQLKDVKRVGGSTSVLASGSNAFYYFNKDSGSAEGQMMTGKQSVTYDGDTYYYNFKSTGEAWTDALIDGVLYDENGVRIASDDGNEIYVIEAATVVDKDNKPILSKDQKVVISKSGKVKRSGSVTIDGQKYTIENYIVK